MWILEIEEGEGAQVKGTENAFNKTIEENLPNLKKEVPVKVQEVCRTPNRLEQERNSPQNIIIKTLNIQNNNNQKNI